MINSFKPHLETMMFSSAFQPSECLKALTYFHGGDLELVTKDTKNILINATASLHALPEVALFSSKLSI